MGHCETEAGQPVFNNLLSTHSLDRHHMPKTLPMVTADTKVHRVVDYHILLIANHVLITISKFNNQIMRS